MQAVWTAFSTRSSQVPASLTTNPQGTPSQLPLQGAEVLHAD